MADSGVKSPNIPSSSIVEDFMGNRNGSTVRIPADAAALQLLATGPFQMLTNAGKLFETLAELNAAAVGDFTPWVFADPDGEKNGIYRRIGSAWVWAMPLPYSFIKATNSGVGTPSAIQADTGIPVSEAALVIVPIAETSDESPVAISFNGQAALTVKSNSGNDIAEGGLIAGMLIVGVKDGETFRLITDQANSAIVAQAEAFAQQARGYRDDTATAGEEIAEYIVEAQGWSTKAKEWAVSMNLIDGSYHSAAYWANQSYLTGGVPIGTKVAMYGNGATTPPGYIKWIPGFEVTSALPDLRAYGLANGWAVNGNGNPVLPAGDSLFERMWLPGQTRDAGRAFGTVQADAFQGHKFELLTNAGGRGTSTVVGQVDVIDGSTTGSVTNRIGNPITDGTNGAPRTATETRVANVTFTWFIKAYSAPIDAATVAAAQVLSDLADARARVAALEASQGWKYVGRYQPSAAAYALVPNLSAYKKIRLKGRVQKSVTNEAILLQFSADNGNAFVTTSTYGQAYYGQQAAAAMINTSSLSGVAISVTNLVNSNDMEFEITIDRLNEAAQTHILGKAGGYNTSSVLFATSYYARQTDSTIFNALRLIAPTGTLTGDFIVEGIAA
ncbi:hypothetical protein ASE04_27440 [Rhizobium sp. Root708]|uniref:hypothetical protein n=1 Tax=Rhizobium sp. Root708 TaxID=1736592 RepID=UPI0006F2F604|nr:hypothetical protein [Rhizobium sp. Root708]KRB58451.1 hypothetical protein ASE04_27440 [Rhizobium sp. Root708]